MTIIKKKEFIIYLVETDTILKVRFDWGQNIDNKMLFGLKDIKGRGKWSNKELSGFLIEACKNTVALLEKFGENALTVEGDIDRKKLRSFIHIKDTIRKPRLKNTNLS